MLLTSNDFLPDGKLIRTIHGGEDTLKKSLIKLKKYEFTGYVKSMLKRDGKISEGYLIIKNGVPVAAVYGRRDGSDLQITKQGEKALKLAWVDSYDDKCEIEVRGRLEVDAFLSEHPESSITVLKPSGKKRPRAKVGISWGDSNNKEPNKTGPSKELKPLQNRIELWRSEGYVVNNLQEALEGPIENAKHMFDEFSENIKKIDFFKDDLESMDTIGHGTEVEKLKALFKNPMKITAIEAAMEDLSDKIHILDDPEESEDIGTGHDFNLEIEPIVAEKPPTTEPIIEKPVQKSKPVFSSVPELDPIVMNKEETIKEPIEDLCGICGGGMGGLDECPICGAIRNTKTDKGKLDDILKTKDTGLIPTFTFENFVVGDNNRFSQAASLAVAKAESSVYNPLLICSGVGLGKTHMINAIGNYVVNGDEGRKVLYITTEKFMQEFIEATRSNKLKAFRSRYRKIDILLLDDIQFIADQEAVQDELFHTFNALYKDNKQIVMSSDCPLKDISGLKDRLVSRFESGLVTDIQAPDLETRVSILRKKAEIAGFVVGDDVLNFISRIYTSNVRLLEGALNKIIAYCELMNTSPTISLAEDVLRDENKEPVKEEPKEKEAEIFDGGVKSDKLKISRSYLVEEDRPEKCFEIFVETLDLGYAGMCISRTNPRRLRGDYDFGESELLWLTDRESSEATIQPALERIIYKIEDLLNTGKKGILLIDGLEYLISNSSFDAVLRFLRRLIDDVSESDSIFLMSVTPGTLDPQDLKILEREMEVISFI